MADKAEIRVDKVVVHDKKLEAMVKAILEGKSPV